MRGFLVYVLTPLCAFAVEGVRPSSWQWRGYVAPGNAVEIRGITGNIRALPSDSGEVEVTANIDESDGVTSDGVTPDVHARELASGVAIGAAVSGARIDFEVRVPAGVHLSAKTINGAIRADALSSDVEAGTVNGSVSVSTTGTVQAKTVNGSIEVELLKALWSKAPELSAVNGKIVLEIPRDTKSAVIAETRNGEIITNIPGFRTTANGRATDGMSRGERGTPLLVRTLNGGIEVRHRL